MGRKSRRKAGARRYADYSQETLSVAVELVKSKSLSSYEAEKQFGIPRRTILNKCQNRHEKPIGRPLELTPDEEKHIEEVVEVCAQYGYPLSILDLRIVVYNYLQKCERTDVFEGRMPGERWARNFLERHNFTQRVTQNIKRSRASKTVDEMTAFYKNLEVTLKDVPCQNILNFDETNLSDDPGSSKDIFKRGTKHPERVMNSSKSSVSIMFSATADGQLLPPYVVYKAEHLWSRWCEFGPPNTRYNRTKSGWFDMVCFDDWFKTIILPWANSREGTKVIIGDNLASHLSVEVIKLCEDNNIRFIFLPRNATHLTQPLDVAFFGPMKKVWRKIMENYKLSRQNSTTINKCDFPQLLQELMTKIDMSNNNNIRSGFAGAGIFPLDPSRVTKKIPVTSTEDRKKFDACLLEYLQKLRDSTTTQSKTGSNQKFVVEPGKSVSTEDAERIRNERETAKANKGKGKGKSKTTKTSQQPKSLINLCILAVNKSLLLTLTRKKRTIKKKKMNSNVCTLSQISKTDKENSPFVATDSRDLPEILQKPSTSGVKSAKKTKIKILSDVLIQPASPNSLGLGNPYTRECGGILPKILQKPNTSDKDDEKSAKKSKIQILSDVLIQPASSNSLSNPYTRECGGVLPEILQKPNPSDAQSQNIKIESNVLIQPGSSDSIDYPNSRKDLKTQHNRSKHINRKRKLESPERHQSVQATSITKKEKNVAKGNKLKRRKKRSRKVSQYSGSTTSVSDDMSEHSDSSLFDIDSECDTECGTKGELYPKEITYSVDDKVLVRYYTNKKTWKYYIGVITACNNDQTFDITFYNTTRNKGELKFKKAKKIDKDTVPIINIEKIIEIEKKTEKPEEYKLSNQEDAVYFEF